MVRRSEMTVSAAFVFKDLQFRRHSSCIRQACAIAWQRHGPKHRGFTPNWTIIEWDPKSDAIRRTVSLDDAGTTLLAGLKIVPLPEAATQLFDPGRRRHEFIEETLNTIRECDAWLKLGIWLFPLAGSRKNSPLRRSDELLVIQSATQLEVNRAYTDVCLQENSEG